MFQMTIVFIGRAVRFSPNSIDKDAAILAAVRSRLVATGWQCEEILPEEKLVEQWLDGNAGKSGQGCLGNQGLVGAVVSMGRSQDTLNKIGELERQGFPVVNGTASVMLCNQRVLLMQVLEQTGVTVPPLTGDDGYWVKRGYGCRETADDVRFVPDMLSAEAAVEEMHQRGLATVDVRAHVVGRWVKFYGVHETNFFRCYDEEGTVLRDFDEDAVRAMAEKAAETVSLDVYGGDCIIRHDGQPVLVDLNDWPSFSPCREEAAEAIAQFVRQKIASLPEEFWQVKKKLAQE